MRLVRLKLNVLFGLSAVTVRSWHEMHQVIPAEYAESSPKMSLDKISISNGGRCRYYSSKSDIEVS